MFGPMKLSASYTALLDNKRQSWIDYDRGISIILVTYRHAYEMLLNAGLGFEKFPMIGYMNVFLFGFRMPLFFITSGIFLSSSLEKKGLKSYNFSRFQNILYPMFIWGILQISLQVAFSGYTNFSHQSIDYIWLLFDPRRTGQFWYLHTLFFVGMLYAILKIKFRFTLSMQMLIGILMYLSLAVIRQNGIYLGFAMDILQYYVFFALGDLISNTIRKKENDRYFASFILFFILLPIFCLVQYNFAAINIQQGSNYYVEHKMPLFFVLIALVGCALSINISFLLGKYNIMGYLRIIGYHSIHIYCMQIILMAATRTLLLSAFDNVPAPLVLTLIIVAGLMLPILFYNMLMKFNCWWLFSPKKTTASKQQLAPKTLVQL
jgi:fucose 4-O-acetylase-like acetyltransferase